MIRVRAEAVRNIRNAAGENNDREVWFLMWVYNVGL